MPKKEIKVIKTKKKAADVVRKNKIKAVNKPSRKLNKSVLEVTKPVANDESDYVTPAFSDSKKEKKFPNWVWLVLVVLLIGLGLAYRSGYVVVATVNGSPIYRWDLNKVLISRFGQQTLDMLVTEKLIAGEAGKQKITISSEEIQARQTDMVGKIGGGVSLEDLLKFQGMTREDFDKQVKMQLTVEKIMEQNTTITDNDVAQFLASNSASLKASSEAELKDQARKMILESKISEGVAKWFTELKANASIRKFL